MEYASAFANIGEPMKDKDLVMLTISGLPDEYNGLKSNLMARHPPSTFSDLHGILSDHDYMINRSATVPVTASPQVFVAATGGTPSDSLPDITTIQSQLNSLSLLASQLGYQLNPISSNNTQTQANYASRPSSNRNNRRGNFRDNSRGQYSTRGRDNNPPNRQFQWASTQNTVYGHCNRCGIGHLPFQCPNQSTNSQRSNPQANFAACSDVGSTSATTWFPDTGANSHVTPDLSNLDNSNAYHGNDSLHVSDGNPLPIFHIGSSKLFSPNKTFNLTNILHVPQIQKNLLSVKQFCRDNNVYFEFHSSFFVLKDESTHTTLLSGPSDNGLYSLCLPQLKLIPKIAFTATKVSSAIWHQRLGHPHQRVFNYVISSCSLPVSTKLNSSLCTSCQLGKS